LVGDELVGQAEEFKTLQAKHNEFLKAYRGREWKLAGSLCGQLGDLSTPYKIHEYYDVMRQRISGYQNVPPPDDWQGVYAAESK